MAEKSFPIMEKPMGVAEWESIALGFSQGVVDEGGWPYLLGPINDVNNTVTILLDQITGVNRALLSGHGHRIDHEKVLTVPAVSTTTTYEVGLVYDPNSTNPDGPITLSVWTTPADYSGRKNRLVLYRITRQPSQVLSQATIVEWRQRVAPRISVSNEANLPKVETMLVDTEARVRNTGDAFRLNKATDGTLSWTKIRSGLTQETLDAAFGGQVWNPATPNAVGHSLVKRFDSGVIRVGTSTEHPQDALNRAAGDGRYASSAHNHSAGSITSGILNRARIDGSTHAYNSIQSGTHFTVSVNSSGRLARFSSTERHKENAEPWTPAPRRLLGPDAWIYDRVDPETREVTNPREVGTIAERNLEDLPEFVQWGPDHVDEDGNPETKELVQGWDYQRWTAAHQRLHKWHAARLDAVTAAVKRIAEATGVDVSDLLEGLEWDDEGEA